MSLSANLNFRFHDGALCLTAAGVEMRLIWDPKPVAEMRLMNHAEIIRLSGSSCRLLYWAFLKLKY